MINVLIVEDSSITRDMIVRKLSENKDFSVFTAIENAANAEIVCMSGSIDLILMDVCTADDESGLKAAMKIKTLYPEIKIILMTSMPEYSFLTRAIEGGIDSFWYKEYGDVDLVEICVRTMSGQRVFPEQRPSIRIGLSESGTFTDREYEIIRELALGNKYGEIAAHLGITENTVKYHVKNIMSKTGCKNTVALVAEVVEKRLVLPKY
ncbi:MAG: response regulator transcription factor [Ruminococcus sp.]|nr:response regulator transcription factor [Ruminococcus sp.]